MTLFSRLKGPLDQLYSQVGPVSSASVLKSWWMESSNQEFELCCLEMWSRVTVIFMAGGRITHHGLLVFGRGYMISSGQWIFSKWDGVTSMPDHLAATLRPSSAFCPLAFWRWWLFHQPGSLKTIVSGASWPNCNGQMVGWEVNLCWVKPLWFWSYLLL